MAERSQPTTEDLLRRLQDGIADVLESILAERVISESPHQITGGGYQTVRLGDRLRDGFRLARPHLLSGFELQGRTACDLGANLGEISRDLRRAGAQLVHAYEYDPLFTQLARYLTAYNGMSDVDHFEADVSAEGFLRQGYDICVGLSAYSFMQHNIDYICGQTAEQMLVETHEVEEGWYDLYAQPIIRHFPHWCCFARVPHSGPDSEKWRLWLTFSKKGLMPFYRRRAVSLVPDAEGVIEIDLRRSTLHFPETANLIFERRHELLSPASLRLYADELAEHEHRLEAGHPVDVSMSGQVYWLALFSGLAQYQADRGLEEGNVYLRWLARGIASGKVDPGLKPLLDNPSDLRTRISPRMAALARALRDGDVSHFGDMPIAFNATPFHSALARLPLTTLAVKESGERLTVTNMDGHHRLFIMKLLDIDSCSMMTIWDPEWLTRTRDARPVVNYETRMYQYLAGIEVEDPVLAV
ncbi:MAG TPA: class I SAM-dependent methyltransferase [Thermoleophilaceae bacterium]